MATLTGTIYDGNEGWSSGAIGSKSAYLSATDETYKAKIKFSITNPSTGYKISQISITIGLVKTSGSASTSLIGKLYTSDPGDSGGTGYIVTATSESKNTNVSGAMYTLTFNIPSNTRLLSGQNLWIWFNTTDTALYQLWTQTSGNVTAPTYSVNYAPDGTIWIYNSSNWNRALPWIYTSSGWKQAIPWIYTSSGWKQCGG